MTIEAYTGMPGEGKTYWMTKDALKQVKRGRKLLTNYPIIDPATGKCFPMYKQIHEIFEAKNCLILMDEASLMAPAQFWNRIPFEVMAHWRQHRKAGTDIWYTAQDMDDVSNQLRRVTQYENQCSRFWKFMQKKIIDPKKYRPGKSEGYYGMNMTWMNMDVCNAYDTNFTVDKQDFLNEQA